MPGQSLAPLPEGRPGAQRSIPPLPAGIPILPGKIRKPAKQVSGCLIVFLAVFGVFGLLWLYVWYSDYRNDKENQRNADDDRRVLQALTPLMVAHAPKGTRIPVTLSDGPRMLQVEFTIVHHERKPVQTCVWLTVFNLKTGLRDTPRVPCIPRLAYAIKQ